MASHKQKPFSACQRRGIAATLWRQWSRYYYLFSARGLDKYGLVEYLLSKRWYKRRNTTQGSPAFVTQQ